MKIYVLDTNVLIYDPQSIFKFEENQVVIPIYVLEEVDSFKHESSERGRNAREVSRLLDKARSRGSLHTGVPLENGGTLRVEVQGDAVPNIGKSLADSKILGIALHVSNKHDNVIVVTKDVNLRVRADSYGLVTEDYKGATPKKGEDSESFKGWQDLDIEDVSIDDFYAMGGLPIEHEFYENEFVMLKGQNGKSALSRYKNGELEKIFSVKERDVWGIRPRNREQHYAIDLLMDPAVKLVTLVGKAGTGKTLIAIAAGLQQVLEEKAYNRLLVARPVFPLGKDIGFLPGSVEEKLNPWMKPIYDSVDFLIGGQDRNKKSSRDLFDQGFIEIEPLTYIRGRSIPNQFLIIDEAQNLTPHEVKTIITRAGEGTKIILTGDPYQIDNPYVDELSNGLSTVVEKFKDYDLVGHVTLEKGERSELAELASNVLK